MAIEATAINEDRLDALMGQVIGELGATVNAGLIVLGDRLGLYRPMAGAWPIRPGKLAQRTGTAERYVREWLNAQAAGGLMEYDPVGERYVLTAEQAMALADEDKPSIRRWGVPVRAPHAQGGRPHRIRLQGPHQHGLARALRGSADRLRALFLAGLQRQPGQCVSKVLRPFLGEMM